MRAHVSRIYWVVCLVGLISTSVTVAQVEQRVDSNKSSKKDSLSEFYHGYYLQNERNDPGAALKAYKRSLSLGADKQLRQRIDSQIEVIQEELAVADFAQLMPSNTVAYFEINQLGQHVERLANAIGITGEKTVGADRAILNVDKQLQIPSDFKISPALLRELNKIRGAAVAITEIGQRGPSLVAVIHPGDSDLITGLVETGVQLVPADETIGGFPTYQIENKAWLVKTKRLVIAASQPDLIQGCIDRINDSESPSIANDTGFQQARKQHDGSAVFAYIQPKLVLQEFGNQLGPEFTIARVVLDLDHIEHVTASLTTSNQGLHFKSNVSFDEQHNSLAYGMIRTVPLSQKALGSVPSGSAAVVGMGLNPKMVLAVQAASGKRLTGLDLGREVFANIEELALFVLPSISNRTAKVPDFGLVIASNDTDKSESLWNQLLEIPTILEMQPGNVSDIQIAGIAAKAYQLPDKAIPQIIVCRLNADSMVAGTHSAVQAAVEAAKNETSLAQDSKAQNFSESIETETAKAVYAHVGRCMLLASQMQRGSEARQMKMVSQVVDDMNLAVLIDEGETNLRIRTDVTGLPQFESVIKSLAQMQSERGKVAAQRSQRHGSRADRTRSVRDERKVQASASDEPVDD